MSVPCCGQFGRVTRLSGRWTTAARRDTPLLVCLHGGGFDSRYFDAPACALAIEAGKEAFPMVALNRPGYPADDESARRQPSFAQAASIVREAISDVWRQLGDGRPGIVLIGHSIGAAVAIHVATEKSSWPLLGLAISGVADVLAPAPGELLRHVPAGIVMSMPPDFGRSLFYGPDWTLKTTTLADIADLGVATPSGDLVEINTRWADDVPKVAPLVDVPVHYVLAEFDGLWEASPERVGEFARHFSGAPFVEASLWRCAGHNIEHHRLGGSYARAVIAFADRCAMETHRPGAFFDGCEGRR